MTDTIHFQDGFAGTDIERIQELYQSASEKFLIQCHKEDAVVPSNSDVPILDTANTSNFDDSFFDICAAAILLKEYDSEHTVPSTIADIVARLGEEGIRHSAIMYEPFISRFAHKLSRGHYPNDQELFTYLIWLEHYKSNTMSFWFYRTLLLWAITKKTVDTSFPITEAYNRCMLSICYIFDFAAFTDPESDRRRDSLSIKEPLLRLLHTVYQQHKSMSERAYITYLIMTLREFSLVVLSALLARGSSYDFKLLGERVKESIRSKYLTLSQRVYIETLA